MRKRRVHTSIWHRLFGLLMAFYVLNVSIDAPDGYVNRNSQGEYREDLSVNEIESVAELVLEDWFDIRNALPEHDEPDEDEERLTKIFMDWALPAPGVALLFVAVPGYRTEQVMPMPLSPYDSRSADITTPPPQHA